MGSLIVWSLIKVFNGVNEAKDHIPIVIDTVYALNKDMDLECIEKDGTVIFIRGNRE